MLRTTLIMFLVLGGCATARTVSQGSRSAAAQADRVTSADRMAVQRANDPHLHSEEEERRWGLQQARQRAEELRLKREQEAKNPPKGADVKRAKEEAGPRRGAVP